MEPGSAGAFRVLPCAGATPLPPRHALALTTARPAPGHSPPDSSAQAAGHSRHPAPALRQLPTGATEKRPGHT